MQAKVVALRKRTLIAKANKAMFLWVAVISILVGAAAVVAIFLTQMLFFNEKVLSEKNNTVTILKSNNASIDDLKKNIQVLDTNQALIDSKAKPEDQAIQVILDALPSDANSLALGASLQNKLLAGINGLTLNSLQVDPVLGVESLENNTSVVNASSDTSGSQNEIKFRFSVSGDNIALQQVLMNLKRSIRTIDIISLKIESQGITRTLSVEGRAFYEPVRVVTLRDKVVKQ